MSLAEYARVYPEAQTVLRELLRVADQERPGHFPDVYIAGSLALDDACPGKSDLDLVLVRPDSATNEESMRALTPAVAWVQEMYPSPAVDGVVLSRSDLLAGPAAIDGPRPVIFEGDVFLSEEGSARNPVTWQTLQQGGITWRGTPVTELNLPRDDAALRQWVRENLQDYWRSLHASTARLTSRGGRWSLQADFVEWAVLGVTRLHATIATGTVMSKTGAGEYALRVFDAYWHKIVREAMEVRANPERKRSLYRRDVLGRRKEARDYVAMVIEDALSR